MPKPRFQSAGKQGKVTKSRIKKRAIYTKAQSNRTTRTVRALVPLFIISPAFVGCGKPPLLVKIVGRDEILLLVGTVDRVESVRLVLGPSGPGGSVGPDESVVLVEIVGINEFVVLVGVVGSGDVTGSIGMVGFVKPGGVLVMVTTVGEGVGVITVGGGVVLLVVGGIGVVFGSGVMVVVITCRGRIGGGEAGGATVSIRFSNSSGPSGQGLSAK